jgi:hypothetical protein
MTRAAFTASELRAAAIVATEQRAVIRMERAGTVCEVKPADLDRGSESGQPPVNPFDLVDYGKP